MVSLVVSYSALGFTTPTGFNGEVFSSGLWPSLDSSYSSFKDRGNTPYIRSRK